MASVTFNGNGDPPQLSTNLPSMREIRIVTKDPQLPVDILLLTVEKCEFLACYKELKDPYRCYFDGLGYVYFEDVNGSQEEKVKVALLRCYKGGIGPGGSLISIKNAVSLLRPKAVISVGTCSGLNPEKTKLGDVVVSAKLTTYASKVVTNDGEQSTGMRSYVSKRFLDAIKNCADGWQAPLQNSEAREVEVHCGEFLSGPEQVSAERRRNQLAKLHPQAIAMEMEGEGVFTAGFDSEIQWLIVKGIADYADGTPLTGESWFPCASVMAASVVAHILSDPAVFRSWPHYQAFPASTPFDLKRCQARLHTFYNTMSQVRITPWNPDDTVHIDEVYTNLSWLRDHKMPSGTSQEKLKDYSELFEGTKCFPKPKRILIYGRPGIGKSTFSQKIAFDWSAGRKEILKKFNVLLMVKLRDVCGLQDFGAVLKASKLLAADDTISADSLHDYIHQNQEQVLLVLDGYDEYSAGVSSPVDQIWEENILRDCYVIMTTRPSEANKLRKSSDVQLQVRGFDSKEQVKEFASKYLTDPQEVKKLMEYLSKEKIWDVAEIPLLLLMMCLVWRDRNHRGLPKSRLELFERFVETLLYQMAVKDLDKGIESNILESYKEELTRIGKLALDALLQGTLYFPLRQLHAQNSALSETMIRTGLFQISKLSSAVPDESVFFLHKSIQEFLAAWFIMHEAGLQDGKTDCLSSIDSLDKVSKVKEILIFMFQWSEEGAKAVFSLLQLVGEKQGLTKYNFTEVPAIEDMSEAQRNFCIMCLDYFQSCPASHRQAAYPSFINCVHGAVVVGYDQRSNLAREHVLKSFTLPKPDFLFFTKYEYIDECVDDMFSIMRDLETVLVTGYGDTKSVPNCPDLQVKDFFLKRNGHEMVLYLTSILRKSGNPKLLVELLSELISAPEFPLQKPSDHVSQNKDASSSLHLIERTYDQTLKHSLSFVREVKITHLSSKDVTVLNNVLRCVNRPRVVDIFLPNVEKYYYNTESLVSCISFTDNLVSLVLKYIDLTAKCVADLARSLHQAPNLHELVLSKSEVISRVQDLAEAFQYITRLSELSLCDVHLEDQDCWFLATSLQHVVQLKILNLSENSLRHGITELGKHLHHVPHLTQLYLRETQMGEEGVTAVAHALKHVPELVVLDLSQNPLGHGITEVGKHLRYVLHLTQLNLRETQMGEEEVTAVARVLRHVPELVVLDLSCNPLGRGVSELIQYLSGIPRLRELWLDCLQMTNKEANELVTAVHGRSVKLFTRYHRLGRVLTKNELCRWTTFDDE